MKYETIFLMIRVQVHADHTSLADMVREVEQESRLELSDTANVNILETEILVSRIHNSNINRKHYEKIPFVPEPACGRR